MEIKIPQCKDQIAIVVVGYNRLKSISRLLDSLLIAHYSGKQVPLVISIDCSGDEGLYQYVREFYWPYGEKYVNIQKERLGLKNHIFQCGDLTKLFKAIVLLEDDLYVSPFFYNYVEWSVNEYGTEDSIAEISLYKNESNGYAGLPFQNIQDGADVFLMQDVSTWGQCWTEKMWKGFVEWRDSHNEEDIQKVDMPERIKKWERAWSKYYLAYVISTGKYILFPNISLTTNFSDAGEHGGTQNGAAQVSLLQGEKSYCYRRVSDLMHYDIYNNNEEIYKWIGKNKNQVCLDMYGNHKMTDKRFILSIDNLPFKVVDSYALYMRPLELNIKYKIKGEGIYLYDTSVSRKNQKNNLSKYVIPYFLKGIKDRYLLEYALRLFKFKMKRKLLR